MGFLIYQLRLNAKKKKRFLIRGTYELFTLQLYAQKAQTYIFLNKTVYHNCYVFMKNEFIIEDLKIERVYQNGWIDSFFG